MSSFLPLSRPARLSVTVLCCFLISLFVTMVIFAWDGGEYLGHYLTPSELAEQYEERAPDLQQAVATSSAHTGPMASTSGQLTESCVDVPTLMYHHIQDLQAAKKVHQEKLTVDTSFFSQHLDYLRDHHYTVISMQDLVDYFDHQKPLPPKPVMLTFDDGYDDFGTNAWPLLKAHGFHATMFLSTGLVEHKGYLQWATVTEIEKDSLVLMADHTYSHHTMRSDLATITSEVTEAEKDLQTRQLNSAKIFAYPYGEDSTVSAQFLAQDGIKLAFTTKHGRLLCPTQRMRLPRVRVGNAPLSKYGL